jgi:hypothetical protein
MADVRVSNLLSALRCAQDALVDCVLPWIVHDSAYDCEETKRAYLMP